MLKNRTNEMTIAQILTRLSKVEKEIEDLRNEKEKPKRARKPKVEE